VDSKTIIYDGGFWNAKVAVAALVVVWQGMQTLIALRRLQVNWSVKQPFFQLAHLVFLCLLKCFKEIYTNPGMHDINTRHIFPFQNLQYGRSVSPYTKC
jgi:hypothetical protein